MSHSPFIYTTISKQILFKEFAPMALKQMSLGAKTATKKDLESRLNRLLIPHFGNQEIKKITPLQVERWQSDLTLTGGSDITRRTKQLLKNILDRAIVYEIIKENPTAPTSKIRDTQTEPREIYSKYEVSRMLKSSDGWLHLFILTMVSLGLRSSEMTGIKFSDIDWKNRKIYIQRNIKWGKFSLPKNGLKRWVDIPQDLLKEFDKAYRERIEKSPKMDYIFITPRGGSYWADASSITKNYFKPLLKRLKIKYKTLYSLRHTYATLSLQGGQKIGYISEQLGHKDIKTTWDYYIKYLHDDNDLNRADNILSF